MKKILASSLIGLLVIGMAGCNNNTELSLEDSKKVVEENYEQLTNDNWCDFTGMINSEKRLIVLNVDGAERNAMAYEFLYEHDNKTDKVYLVD